MVLRRFSKRPLQLDLEGDARRWRSPQEFDHFLASRSSPTPAAAAAFAGLAREELGHRRAALGELEQRILRALAHPDDRDTGVGPLLREIDLADVAEDQGWRALLSRLRVMETGFDDYKRVALGAYQRYLCAAQDFVRVFGAAGGAAPGPQPGAAPGPPDTGPRQTLGFDLDVLAGAEAVVEAASEEFNRLPKGETLEIAFGPHQALPLLLAKHRFALISGSPFLLVDGHGNDYRVRPGKSVVGRSLDTDVPIDPFYRDVSRRHLIVDTAAMDCVRLTDISSLGTFVPRAYLDNRLH
jgi:hypothetical protein